MGVVMIQCEHAWKTGMWTRWGATGTYRRCVSCDVAEAWDGDAWRPFTLVSELLRYRDESG